MAKSIQQILGYLPLSKAIQQTTSGIPQPFPEAFMKSHQKVSGNKTSYVRYTGERRTARIGKYGSPPRKADLRDVGEKDVKLIATSEEQSLDPHVFRYLRSDDAYEFDKGLQQVRRQVREFAQKFANLRIAAVAHVLRRGRLDYDADGNLLPDTGGSIENHTFDMNANNQNQLNGIITASWALASTDIPLQLRNLKKRARRLTGYPLKYALYGENIPSYLTQNDYVLDYLARNPAMQTKWLETAEIPDGLFGLTWVPVYEAFYEDSAGTNQDLWAADAVTFTPEVSEDWWDVIEGSHPVPTSINVMTDADAAMRSMKEVFGTFGYGYVELKPVSVTGVYGDCFIPCLKNADVCFAADTTP